MYEQKEYFKFNSKRQVSFQILSYTIYVDGSAHPNPGPGGFGVVVYNDEGLLVGVKSFQFEGPITNNEMELKGILYALEEFGGSYDKSIFPDNCPVVYSDSNYAVMTYTKWMHDWARKGWIKSDKKTPENLSIIKRYYDLCNQGYKIDLRLTKGHAGTLGNEIADMLATNKISEEQAIKRYGGRLNG